MITQVYTCSAGLSKATKQLNDWLRENQSIIISHFALDESEDGNATFALLYKETFAPPLSVEEIVNVLTLQIEHAAGGLDIENATSLYTRDGVVYAGSLRDYVEISRDSKMLDLVESMLILNGRRNMVNVPLPDVEDNEPRYLGGCDLLYPE